MKNNVYNFRWKINHMGGIKFFKKFNWKFYAKLQFLCLDFKQILNKYFVFWNNEFKNLKNFTESIVKVM